MFERMLDLVKANFTYIWSFVLMLLVWLPNLIFSKTAFEFTMSVALFLCYLLLFLIPQHLLKPLWMWMATLFVGSLTLIKVVTIGPEGYAMILLLAIFIGLRSEGKQSYIMASVFGLLTILLIVLVHKDYIGAIPFSLAIAGTYSGARGYRIHREAYEKNQQHLIELQQAHEELQEAHREVQEAAVNTMQVAVLEERTRIARDIHDDLGHSLTSLIVQMRALQYMLKNGPSDAQDAVSNMLEVAKKGLDEIRNSVHTLASEHSALGLSPLRAFLSQTEKNTGLTCKLLTPDASITLTKEMTIVFYRTIQEAITNILRHSDAKHVEVIVRKNEDYTFLTIQDDGTISPDDDWSPGFGLSAMTERIRKLHGSLTYFVRKPHGFQIDVMVPNRIPTAERAT
ncbi:MAG: sensor histidine kinase [Clostridia bacterium]